MVQKYNDGDVVIAKYKTGEYIGRFVQYRNETYGIVEILAVRRHPTQGDLHHPNEVNVPLFHQRRALSHHEKAVVNLNAIQPYDGDIPEYKTSLKTALEEKVDKLKDRNDPWAEEARRQMADLEKEYFK